MKKRLLIGVVTAAMTAGFGSGLGFAAPAAADPDTAFTNELNTYGIYGQKDRTVGFTVGDAMVSKVDMNSHQMRVFRNGELLRTIPITTGEQPKFTTRSGTKVFMEKFLSRRMSSETTGIPVDSAISENGGGQFEINLLHVADPLKAADDAILLDTSALGIDEVLAAAIRIVESRRAG